MPDKMKELIEQVFLKIKEAIEESNLQYLRNLVMDLLHYGMILNNDDVILITSEMKTLISAYQFITEELTEHEETIQELKEKLFQYIPDFYDYLKKIKLEEEDKLNLINLIQKTRINAERDMHYFTIRGMPKLKIEIPSNLMELEE